MPTLVRNRGENGGEDEARWGLTSRFFLVDVLSGASVSDQQKKADIGAEPPLPITVRYAKGIEIRVKALNTRDFPEKAGRIYPPLLVIEYDEVVLNDDSTQVWSQTQFYFVDFSKSSIGVKSACSAITQNQGLHHLFLTVSWDLFA